MHTFSEINKLRLLCELSDIENRSLHTIFIEIHRIMIYTTLPEVDLHI